MNILTLYTIVNTSKLFAYLANMSKYFA